MTKKDLNDKETIEKWAERKELQSRIIRDIVETYKDWNFLPKEDGGTFIMENKRVSLQIEMYDYPLSNCEVIIHLIETITKIENNENQIILDGKTKEKYTYKLIRLTEKEWNKKLFLKFKKQRGSNQRGTTTLLTSPGIEKRKRATEIVDEDKQVSPKELTKLLPELHELVKYYVDVKYLKGEKVAKKLVKDIEKFTNLKKEEGIEVN